MILGEAKWNSPLGTGQGLDKDRSQLDLRLAYCDQLAARALPDIRQRVVLGVGRTSALLSSTTTASGADVRNLSWATVAACFEPPLAEELERHLKWRHCHSSPAA
jgi:hypothetical protein